MAEMHETHDKNLSDLETKGDIFAAETPMSSTTDLFEDGSVDPVYQAKARVLNSAMQEIGMGKYQVRVNARSRESACSERNDCLQWWLFAIAGFGWFAYVDFFFTVRTGTKGRLNVFSDSVWPVSSDIVRSLSPH